MSIETITAALAAHADSGNSDPSPEMDSLGNTPEIITSPEGDEGQVGEVTPVVPEVVDPAQAEAAKVEQDEIDKLLAKEGISATSTRGENRIPYSRTKSIIKNAQTEWHAQHVTPLQTRLDASEGANRNYRNSEQLAMSDPRRYIMSLAAADPRYQEFLNPQAASPAVATKTDDPEPQPLKDEAGNPYYTPERWQEVQAWNRRQGVKDATAAIEAKYGPILSRQMQADKAKADFEARKPVVDREIKSVKDAFGATLVDTHQAAIIKVMQDAEARGYQVSLAEAAAQVLLPMLRVDEATMRTKIVADLNKRPAAASRTVGASQRGATGDDGGAPLTGVDVIKQALDRALPNRNR